MDLHEYAKARFKESAEIATHFWSEVKKNLSGKTFFDEEKFTVLDMQQLSDNSIDLLMVRSDGTHDLDQIEHWRFIAESRLFRKPKIKIIFTSGPFAKDFL